MREAWARQAETWTPARPATTRTRTFTASAFSSWCRRPVEPSQPGEGEIDRPFVVRGSYFAARRYVDDIVRDELPMRFESEHRPLETYARALEYAGFAIEAMREVGEPDPASKWSRMPLLLDLRAVRA
jgi:hypothetical protein